MTVSRSNDSAPGGMVKSPSATATIGGRHHQLNRFLSKTFHMVNSGDRNVICWNLDGDGFMVKDIEEFSETVLPRYFKHSKFSSFVRQLNFYGFRKIRSDCPVMNQEDGMEPQSVQFYHEYFQRDRPDLLHKINRATKNVAGYEDTSNVESLQSEIETLKERLDEIESTMDLKLMRFKQSLETDYQRRIRNLENGYHEMLLSALALRAPLTPGLGAGSLLGAIPSTFLALSGNTGRGRGSPSLAGSGHERFSDNETRCNVSTRGE